MIYLRRYNESVTIKATDDTIKEIVHSEINKLGNDADLNHIDVSGVTNMRLLFDSSPFNGNISNWNVGNVTNMYGMFYSSKFNGDISNWNVGNVNDMMGMFAHSNFNSHISNWNVGNVQNMSGMFYMSHFNSDISNWNVQNVQNMNYMFGYSKFNGDLNRWVIKNKNMDDMFTNCPLDEQKPWWYQMFNLFIDKQSMYGSIEVYDWIDLQKKIIWKKRLNYALQDFGVENYKIPNNIKGFTIS